MEARRAVSSSSAAEKWGRRCCAAGSRPEWRQAVWWSSRPGYRPGLDRQPEIVWYSSPQELPTELRPDAVVFAVKPQIADEVVPDYRSWAAPETLFVSIVAGKTLAGLARHLGRAAIVRTMPNTPAAIGRGITVACANPLVTHRSAAALRSPPRRHRRERLGRRRSADRRGHGGLRQRPGLRVPADRSARSSGASRRVARRFGLAAGPRHGRGIGRTGPHLRRRVPRSFERTSRAPEARPAPRSTC